MQVNLIRHATTIAVLLALFVVGLGAYTRLTDAGLGCPDWPGCYGQLVLPGEEGKRVLAQQQFPEIPIESAKAWTEMAHRYAAGTLGLLILFISGSLIIKRLRGQKLPWRIPLFLTALLFFQAALGMWTVTLKLLPVVVMGHLLGGILIFASLARLRVQLGTMQPAARSCWYGLILLGTLIVFIQIALGGWVSSNYAGIACIGFPQCNGQWLPALHLEEAFNVFAPIGANYQGGVLDSELRVTIQFIHRLGALITALYLFGLSLAILFRSLEKPLRCLASIVLLLLSVQLLLGILNVIYLLPLSIAVAHNMVAALLMGAMFSLLYLGKGRGADVC